MCKETQLETARPTIFLNLLDNDQRTEFFRAAAFLAAVDGVDERETARIEQARLECGLPKSVTDVGASLDDVVGAMSKIESVAARNAMALELAGILVADDEHSAEEKVAFAAIASALGIGEHHAARAIELATSWQQLADDSTDYLSEA